MIISPRRNTYMRFIEINYKEIKPKMIILKQSKDRFIYFRVNGYLSYKTKNHTEKDYVLTETNLC